MIKKIKYSLDEDACYYYWVDDALVGPYETPEKALDKFISHISTCTEYNEPNIKYKLLDSAVVLANELEKKDIKYTVVDKEYDEVLEEKEELQKEYDRILSRKNELEDELEERITQHEQCRAALKEQCKISMMDRQRYDEKRKEFDDLLNTHDDVCTSHSSLLDKVKTLKERYE